MINTRTSASLPSVLKQLGKMTMMRDSHLVEQGLLCGHSGDHPQSCCRRR